VPLLREGHPIQAGAGQVGVEEGILSSPLLTSELASDPYDDWTGKAQNTKLAEMFQYVSPVEDIVH